MKSLSIGYFLSVVNALIFAFPTVMFYPALITYPPSIILRGIGWRKVSKRPGTLGRLYPAIWGLGAVTYASLFLSYFGVFEYGLWTALAAWTMYSALEAAIYLSAARRLRIRLFYASPISLIGVAIIVALVIMSSEVFQFTGVVRYGELAYLFLGSSACLAASAIVTALASLKIGAEKPVGGEELESLLVSRPQPTAATIQTRQSVPRPTATKTTKVAAPPISTTRTARARIQLEVISRSDMIVCLSCGASATLGAERCPECGGQFKKVDSGLRCPVCGAPFSLAKAISRSHYVCGQCFSDLRVTAT
ncbi:MAG: zinc ribbon domain-containing protein [Nitrososphaerota archaeon]